MRRQDDVNGKQVGAGCLIIILIGIVGTISNGEGAAIKAICLIVTVVLFLLGAFLTGAFKD